MSPRASESVDILTIEDAEELTELLDSIQAQVGGNRNSPKATKTS